MILALETTTEVCSVAFRNDAGKVFEKRSQTHGSHSENLFLFIRALMDKHSFSMGDLSAVLVSEGPGSYTGLRIAASGVKGLLFDLDVPLFAVQTLASFACAAINNEQTEGTIHSVIDARRKHVYHQKFELKDERLRATSEVATVPIEDLEKKLQKGDQIIGTGLSRFDARVLATLRVMDEAFISARSLIRLYQRSEHLNFMQHVEPGRFDPNYYTSAQVY